MNHCRFAINKRITVLALVGLLLTIVVWEFAAPQTAWAQSGPIGAAYRGQRIFNENCTKCHGEQGRGDGPLASQAPVPIPDFSDAAYVETRSPQEIFAFIRDGSIENLMPPWGDSLSDTDIWDAVAYVWSFHLQEGDQTQGRLVYQVACAQCHGDNGEGLADSGPELNSHLVLGEDQQTLRQAVLAETHPAVDQAAMADLDKALIAVRGFTLGIGEASPVLTGNGTITVTVNNGTTQAIMPDLPVRLVMFEGENFSDIQEATSDADGQAVFNNLPVENTWAYIVEVMYNSVPYDSEMLQFDPANPAINMPISVYEMGATLADVRISRAHWVISIENPNQVDVGELYAFTNTGDRVYLGDGGADVMPPEVLRFEFPEGATNLSVDGSDSNKRFIINGNIVIDTLPLPPGTRQVLFRYSLPVQNGEVTLGHTMTYPVDFLNLLVPDVGIEVVAPDWTVGEVLKTQSGSYLNYVLTELPVGAQPSPGLRNISADIMPPPVANAQQNQQIIDANATPGISGLPYLPWLLGLVSALVLIIGTLAAVRHQRRVAATLPHMRQRLADELIEQIAELDDGFEAGEIDRADYTAQRQMLKAQLAKLIKQERS